MPKPKKSTEPSRRNDVSEVPRIIEKFEELARNIGPRHVGMSHLAAELGISTKTLYQHFPTKSDLVTAMIRHRLAGWQNMRDAQLSAKMPALQRIHRIGRSWVNYVTSFSPDFWQQLARDFPDAQAVIDKEYATYMSQGGKNLVAILRDDHDPRIALNALKTLLERAADVRYCKKMGLSPATVLRQHIAIWAGGAVRPAELVTLEVDEPWTK